MCIELSDEGIRQREGKIGERLRVAPLKGHFALIGFVSDEDPEVAVHPPQDSVLRVSGIPELRQKSWGVKETAEAVPGRFNPDDCGTDYDWVIFRSGPTQRVDVRAFIPGMEVEIIPRQAAAPLAV